MVWTDERLRKELPRVHGKTPLYRLRWRFDFANKPSRYGGWNGGSQKPAEMAAFVNKSGLIRAAIQGEKVQRNDIRILAEVEGHNFVGFTWEAGFMAPVYSRVSTFRKESTIIGLSILTRIEKITIFIDGKIKTRFLTEDEREFKLEEHKGDS